MGEAVSKKQFTKAELREHFDTFQANAESAARRGLGWELTFQQWLELWADRIHERGPYKGQYVLCRKNDLGPYAVGNCYVASKSHNSSVRGYMETRTNATYLGNLPEGVDIAKSRLNPKHVADNVQSEMGYWHKWKNKTKPGKRRFQKDRDKIVLLMEQALTRGY